MTSQSEVALAFVRGDEAPNVASNFRRLQSDDGSREYLCGGRNGEELVYAVKEPIHQFQVYTTIGFADSTMNYGATRRQSRMTRRLVNRYVDRHIGSPEDYVTTLREDALLVENVDDIP